MNWGWEFTSDAQKQLLKLSKPDQKRIILKLDYFMASEDPLTFSQKMLNSQIGSYRFRVGDYRIIFDLEDDLIVVVAVGHRKDIYR
ncbi:hypothetical protein A3A70_00320 [candidate division WWE3 bacterium RIFCSPLOWO2_01_FULL_42_11]|uniref:Addiction module toxin RelE n=1 Tax=candidate division WWE3 bacterium RIFCSPLOWO2_01_FULL_42_11 TaxID=1802627 RepID=A0A1F4VPG3_UNCKA|nr:MAG: hypothetical protein A3A70_00320 [candidate division WWE3 bacterium RIFCSPLOWO2_01_FULL_42_11]